MFDAVWHHTCSPTSEGEGGVSASTALDAFAAARLATILAVGDTLEATARVAVVGLVGAGDAVEVREGFFVGEGSNAGKSPRGCWRVATILLIRIMRSR